MFTAAILSVLQFVFCQISDEGYKVLKVRLKLELSYPTEEEIDRAFLSKPSLAWGRKLRHSKSIRVLNLGGSNSVNWDYLYPKKVDEYLKTNVSSSSYFRTISVAGQGPLRYLKSPTFGFENSPFDIWPNVICFEYSLNTGSDLNGTRNVDWLMHIINRKYKHHNLPRPSFMFIELFKANIPYNNCREWGQEDCVITSKKDRIKAIRNVEPFNFDENLVQFNFQGLHQRYMASYYWIPVLSYKEAFYPSFVRHFIYYNQSVRWPFVMSSDLFHLNELAHNILSYNIIIPFFINILHIKEDMKEKNSHLIQSIKNYERNQPYGYDIRLFHPPTDHITVLEFWKIWGNSPDDTFVHNLIVPTSDWRMLHYKNRGLSYCYSSTVKEAVAKFKLFVPPICSNDKKKTHCEVYFSYLRSWNNSMIGDLDCSLYTMGKALTDIGNRQENEIKENNKIAQFLIKGNELHNKDTTQQISVLFNLTKSGWYNIFCKKPNEKLSCIGAVGLNKVTEHLN